MIDLEKMANYIADKMSAINVKHQQCAKVRSPLSKCNKCRDICPRQGIIIERQKVSLANNCLECGLCASVCPTGAISLQEPNIIVILNKIEQMYNDTGVVNVSCRRNIAVDDKCIKLPCLGALAPEMLLVMRLYGFPIYMIYSEEECAACPVTGGLETYLKRMEMIEGLIGEFALVNELIATERQVRGQVKEPAKKEGEVDIDRRALFGSLFKGIKSVPAVVIQSYLEEDVKDKDKLAIRKVTDYIAIDRIEILKKRAYDKILMPDKELHLLQQPSLVEPCYFCKACTILCPTGALEYREDDNEIILNHSRCTGCNLCVDVCFHKSLHLMPVSLDMVATNTSTVIAKASTNICENCQKPFIASETVGKCPKCQSNDNYKISNF